MARPTAAAIASESPHTVQVGARLAELGGNAVDIAVGCALAATVSESLMCSLGGSAFVALKSPAQKAEIIDGADVMPSIPPARAGDRVATWRQVSLPYGDGITVNVGHSSVAVPGMLRALELAWLRHGSLPWSEVLAPAVDLARSGCRAGKTLATWLGIAGELVFRQQEESRASFFPNGTDALQQGEHFRIPHLDGSLELIAREGADAFYEGDLAAAFSREVLDNQGFVTREDLSAYRSVVRRPLLIESRGFELALNPPPSIGGAMLGSMVRMFDFLWRPGMTDADTARMLARVQRMMFSLRSEEGRGDWSEARAKEVLHGRWLRRFFDKVFAPNTMHLSVSTSDGTVVAITMSNGYGSGISIPGTGIATNNSLGEPELNPAGFLRIPPGGRLVSNMSPTVAWRRDGTSLAMGSPGASRIATTILQGWMRFAYEGLGFEEMVRAPRLHVENVGGDFLAQYEPGIDVSEVAKDFGLRAFVTQDMYFGALNIAGREPGGRLHALADRRRQGAEYISSEG